MEDIQTDMPRCHLQRLTQCSACVQHLYLGEQPGVTVQWLWVRCPVPE